MLEGEFRPTTLAEALETLEAVFDTDPGGIFIYSADGRLVECNQAACEMHGFEKAQMLSMAPRDFIHPDGYQTFLDFQSELDRAGSFQGESAGLTATGEKFDVEVFGKRMTIGGRPYLYSVIRNVTHTRRELDAAVRHERALERKVSERTRNLERSNRELDQFATLVSHDLRSPLRTISGFLELLEARYEDRLDEQGRAWIGLVIGAADRMGRLIEDLLDHGRIGKLSEAKQVDLNAVLGTVVGDLAAAIDEAGATVEVAALPTIEGQEAELQMLFQNLIGNAIKFRKPDRPPTIRVWAEAAEGAWQFGVADDGIGIEPDLQGKIFEPFQRLHGRDAYEGNGIGLAHCRKIVDLHDGRIWVESRPGEGSAFRFTLRELAA